MMKQDTNANKSNVKPMKLGPEQCQSDKHNLLEAGLDKHQQQFILI
jgi:hypothetical protein